MGSSVLLFSSDVFLFFRWYIPFHAKSNRRIEKRNIRVKIKRPREITSGLFDNLKDAIVETISNKEFALGADLYAMRLKEFHFFRWAINSSTAFFFLCLRPKKWFLF